VFVPARHVVGVEDGHAGGLSQARLAQHLDVEVGDGQDGGGPVGGGGDGAVTLDHGVLALAAAGDHGVAGQEGR
jgi:hypothetical protein